MKLPLVSATDPAAQPELLKLDREMARFYNSAATAQYYAQAHGPIKPGTPTVITSL